MKFGKVDNPETVDFEFPADHPDTGRVLEEGGDRSILPEVYVGCARWSKQELKNLYPRGTKDDLAYYTTQFNAVEHSAFFYRIFPPEQVIKWKERAEEGFKFYPKLTQTISQFRRLRDTEELVDQFVEAVSHFGDKLGMCFLQMHPSFGPQSFGDLEYFVQTWPRHIDLSVELRHPDWYADEAVFTDLCAMLEANETTHVITDTAGRRDMIHMRLTTPKCFVRYTGANHESDYTRLDDWIDRLKDWKEAGIKEINFFVHQNVEEESPLLTAYLNRKLNEDLGLDLTIPQTINSVKQGSLDL